MALSEASSNLDLEAQKQLSRFINSLPPQLGPDAYGGGRVTGGEGQRDPERSSPPCQVTQKGKTMQEVALGNAHGDRGAWRWGLWLGGSQAGVGERWRGLEGEGCGHQVAKVPAEWTS